jgi:hypothetical protein
VSALVAGTAARVATALMTVRATTAQNPPCQPVKWLSKALAGPPAIIARPSPLTTTPEARAVRSGVTRPIAVTAATAQNPA